MSDLTFNKGKFLFFKAKNTIHLGRLERNIFEGDVVEFDGFTLKFNGQSVDMPELKAGIKRGWLTPTTSASEQEAPAPKKAKEEPKKPEVQVVYDEERSVNSVKKEEVEAPAPNKFPIVVESSDEDTKEVSFVKDSSGATISSASSASDGNAMAEAQASKSIKPALKTASKQKTILTDASAIDRELSKLEELEGTRSSFKVTVIEDQNQASSLDDEEEVQQEINSPNEDLQTLQAMESSPATGVVVTGQDDSKIVTLEGGIEWNMNIHWAKRAKKAVELYANDPDTLELIYQVETKGVIASIQKALAELA